MLGKPRFPGDGEAIADLKHHPRPPPLPAPHQPRMPPVRAREHIHDEPVLAVTARRENESFVCPFHEPTALRETSISAEIGFVSQFS